MCRSLSSHQENSLKSYVVRFRISRLANATYAVATVAERNETRWLHAMCCIELKGDENDSHLQALNKFMSTSLIIFPLLPALISLSSLLSPPLVSKGGAGITPALPKLVGRDSEDSASVASRTEDCC